MANIPCTIALTGGIASGKSAVAARFAARGVAVVDTDHGARAVVVPGSDGLAAVIEAFGPTVAHTDGSLDRGALREIVFRDVHARKHLESILHPLIRAWVAKRIAQAASAYVLLVVPLLVETWPAYDWVHRVLLVDAPDALRLERLMQRDDIERSQAQRMLAAQASREDRLALADDVIVNDDAADKLDPAVAELHRRYLEMSSRLP